MRNWGYILLLIIQACTSEGIGCFTPAGERESKDLDVSFYNQIEITGNINILLVSDDPGKINVTAGSNELTGIKVEVKDSVLFISNENTCNWSRKYGSIDVKIPYKNAHRFVLHGSGTVAADGTIEKSSFDLISLAGSGDFKLDLDVDNLYVSSNEIANFYLSGSATNVSVGFYFNEGILFAQDLNITNCQVIHRGTNAMHLNLTGILTGSLDSFGDVILYGQLPDSIDVELNSRGRVINNF